MGSPYTYKSPRSTCVHCGDRIIKLSVAHDDSFWRHEHNNAWRCPSGKQGVKSETFAMPAQKRTILMFEGEEHELFPPQEHK